MRKKSRHEMTINELIADAGWFKGDEAMWQSLPLKEREELAFAATGCEVAYATWPAPVECVHTRCQIRRGELPKIALTNGILRGEMSSGWLRFHRDSAQGRSRLAKICRGYRRAARATGVYDPWKLDWSLMVSAGVMA